MFLSSSDFYALFLNQTNAGSYLVCEFRINLFARTTGLTLNLYVNPNLVPRVLSLPTSRKYH